MTEAFDAARSLRDMQNVKNDNSSDNENENYTSGTGILEFSPTMAGHDVTPANFDFNIKRLKKSVANSSFQSIADTISHFALNAVKPIRFQQTEFQKFSNDPNQMSKETSIEVNIRNI